MEFVKDIILSYVQNKGAVTWHAIDEFSHYISTVEFPKIKVIQNGSVQEVYANIPERTLIVSVAK
jgi:hypothetical protein